MEEHFNLADGFSMVNASCVFNNATRKAIKDAFKHSRCISVATYYMHVLKQEMKPTQVKEIYLIKDQHLQGSVDCLVKDPKA
jgi:hypothetical protein